MLEIVIPVALLVVVLAYVLTTLASIRSRERFVAALKEHERKIMAHRDFLNLVQRNGERGNSELKALLDRAEALRRAQFSRMTDAQIEAHLRAEAPREGRA